MRLWLEVGALREARNAPISGVGPRSEMASHSQLELVPQIQADFVGPPGGGPNERCLSLWDEVQVIVALGPPPIHPSPSSRP